ncbi:MAG: hypothetical protein MZV65_19130 [Chromatiales bacterium]|nr:hypothetical protein [Chromatiales bacterium]
MAVAYDGEPRGGTDADGRINIRLRHGGVQLISASFDEPLQDARADKAVRATVLQFQLAEQESMNNRTGTHRPTPIGALAGAALWIAALPVAEGHLRRRLARRRRPRS